jgi:hypothetical protein
MAEEILRLDEVERIAKEYVRQKENVADVQVRGTELSCVGELLIYVVDGKARRTTVDWETREAGVVEELPFKLQVSAKDGDVRGYRPCVWRKENDEQAPSVSSQVLATEGNGLRKLAKKYGINASKFGCH